MVDASGRRVQRTLSGGDAELALDACAQAVVPWRPLGAGWGDALLRDVEGMRSLDGRLLRTQARSLAPPYEEGLRALGVVAASVVEAAARQSTIKAVAVEAGAAVRSHIEKAVAAAVEEQKRVASGSLADTGKLEVQIEAVRTAVARLHPEALAAAALHTSGGVGARMYAAGQKLTVRHVGGWHDAEVGKGGVVWLEGGRTVALHPWNHAPLELPSDGFEKVRDWHLNSLRVQHSHIVDALSGQRLDSLQQLVAIDVKGGSSSAVRDARTLSVWLRKLHEERVIGGALETPPAVLLTAGPAAGKTTLLSQLVVLALDGELVPVLVKVQRLQRLLVDAADSFAHAWNWVDTFLRLEHGDGPYYRMLRQAMLARRALLFLDGLDEGGMHRADIEQHVAEVLAPQGHVMLVTSRPAGVRVDLFASFRQLSLSPLTDAQQEKALEQRLGAARTAELMPYVRDRVPHDTETGHRVTANPLMLSMVASVFEFRRGLEMPKTLAELYKTASDLMLARGGDNQPELRRLLQAIFFEAHVSQQRIIEDHQLDEAAIGLTSPEALAAIRERAVSKPFEPFDGRAEVGHYIEVVVGQHAGKRGVISTDDKSDNPYKVTFADGTVSSWLKPDKVRSSGLDETALLVRAMVGSADELHAERERLPQEMGDALRTLRERVMQDKLPLLSLLQVEPLQLQSSHLSFQEYFAARAICEGGARLSGVPPWQWPAWWSNTVKIGSEMGDVFGKGLLRASGVDGDSLDLAQKLGGDRPTVLGVLTAVAGSLTSLKCARPSEKVHPRAQTVNRSHRQYP